jgi:hypothetical protein
MGKLRPTPERRTSSEADEPPVETRKIIKVAPTEEQSRRLGPIFRQGPLRDFLTHMSNPRSVASERFEIRKNGEDPP